MSTPSHFLYPKSPLKTPVSRTLPEVLALPARLQHQEYSHPSYATQWVSPQTPGQTVESPSVPIIPLEAVSTMSTLFDPRIRTPPHISTPKPPKELQWISPARYEFGFPGLSDSEALNTWPRRSLNFGGQDLSSHSCQFLGKTDRKNVASSPTKQAPTQKHCVKRPRDPRLRSQECRIEKTPEELASVKDKWSDRSEESGLTLRTPPPPPDKDTLRMSSGRGSTSTMVSSIGLGDFVAAVPMATSFAHEWKPHGVKSENAHTTGSSGDCVVNAVECDRLEAPSEVDPCESRQALCSSVDGPSKPPFCSISAVGPLTPRNIHGSPHNTSGVAQTFPTKQSNPESVLTPTLCETPIPVARFAGQQSLSPYPSPQPQPPIVRSSTDPSLDVADKVSGFGPKPYSEGLSRPGPSTDPFPGDQVDHAATATIGSTCVSQ